MGKTIQGKSVEEILSKLRNLVSTEDYSFMDKTGTPYFKGDMLCGRARELLGFNWETSPRVLNSEGDLYKVKEELGQINVSVLVDSIIKYDDGTICNKSGELGIYSLKKEKEGDGYTSIVDAVKSAQTAAKKLALMEFINSPDKPKNPKKCNNKSNGKDFILYHCQVIQAGTLMHNGMIKIPVLCNGVPKVVVYYSDTASTIATKQNMTTAALAVAFKPGMNISLYALEKSYGNELQLIAQYKEGESVPNIVTTTIPEGQTSQQQTAATSEQTEQTSQIPTTKDFKGDVIVNGAGKLMSNGMIKVPCLLNDKAVYVVIYPPIVENLCGNKYQPQEFAQKFEETVGKAWTIKGTIQTYGGEQQIAYKI